MNRVGRKALSVDKRQAEWGAIYGARQETP